MTLNQAIPPFTLYGRLGNTKNVATRLGIPSRIFLELAKLPDFPKPVRNKHRHKWWDFKAIEQYLDKKNKIEPELVDYDSIVRQRLAKHGGVQNEIRC